MQSSNNAEITAENSPTLTPLEPDFEEAWRFLELLDPEDGQFTFQTFPDKKDASGVGGLTRVLHGFFHQHANTLASLNRDGAGVFVMINQGDGVTHPGNKTCRTIKNVVRVRYAFVDLDGSPLEPVLAAPVAPSIVVESSPSRWHAYWHLNDCPLEQFKPMQIALAEKFGGDPSVNDLCRVMRLPGFIHHKHDPFMTRIVNTNKNQEEK